MLFEVKPCIAISEKPQLVFVQWDDLASHSSKKEPWHAILNTDTHKKRQLYLLLVYLLFTYSSKQSFMSQI